MGNRIDVVCDDVLTSITLGKKKYYLSSNVFYGGVHFMIRKKIVEQCKLYLSSKFKRPFAIISESELPLSINICYKSPKHTFDLDNKSSFWLKVILDFVKTSGMIADDNVKFISQISSEYVRLEKGSQDELLITIKSVNDK